MMSRLKLNGNELLCYAVIYGFSQDGVSMYMGSINYMKRLLNVSHPTIIKALKSLCDRGLIQKHEVEKDKVRLCYYNIIESAIDNAIGGTKETLVGGTKETLVNNNNIDIYKDKEKNNNKEKETIADLFKEDNPEIQFNEWFENSFPTLSKNKRPLKYRTYCALTAKYTKEQIIMKLNSMESMANFNRKYTDVGRVLWNWLERDNKK